MGWSQLSCVAVLFACVLVKGRSDNATASENVVPAKERNVVSFYAIADGPYGSRGRNAFAEQLQRLEDRPEFLVHLGDVRERQKACNLELIDRPADDLLKHVLVPTFAIPGDSDWYHCNDQSGAFQKWSDRFLMFHLHWTNHSLDVKHQKGRQENFAFVRKGVLFVGLHVLYATVSDWTAWNELVHDDTVWFDQQMNAHAYNEDVGAIVLFAHAEAHPRRYKEFYDSLLRHANALQQSTSSKSKPILYLQGDAHHFVVDRHFPPSNILRVVLDEAAASDPLEVTIDAFGAVPFKFHRRPTVSA